MGCLYPTVITFLLLLAGDCFGQAPLSVTAVATSACAAPSSTITATASGGTLPYQYAVDVPPYQISPVFVNQTPGPHTVFVVDGAGNFSTFSITIGCIYNILIQTTSASCGGNNGGLSVTSYQGGTGAVVYSIDGGTTYQSSPAFPGIPGGLYTVWVKDASNTIGVTTAIVGGIPGATPVPTPQPASCVNNDGSISVSTTGGLPPFAYKIDGGSFGSAFNFSGLASGPHTVYVLDGNGCQTSAPVTVLLNNTLVLNMGGDATICEGKSVVLGATSPNGVSYAWTPATGLSNAAVLNPTASPVTTTTYTLTASWGACTRGGSETVNVNPAPVADAGPPDTTCYGKSVQLQGSGVAGGGGAGGGLSYRWRPFTFLNNASVADPTVVGPTASITYTLVVTDGNGCSSLNKAPVTVTVTPPPQLFAGNDTNVVAGQPVPLRAVDVSHSGFVQWAWTPGAELIGADTAVAVWPAATQTTTFVVTGTTAGGCIGVDSVTVEVYKTADIYVPNAFSPNHDGHNDVLRVVAPSIRVLKVFAVYDRWGAQVFTTANPGVGWDGTRGGRELASGVYVWVAVGVDYQGRTVERRGTVMLVR